MDLFHKKQWSRVVVVMQTTAQINAPRPLPPFEKNNKSLSAKQTAACIVSTTEAVIPKKAKRTPTTIAIEWLLLRRKVPVLKLTLITLAVDAGFSAALTLIGFLVGYLYEQPTFGGHPYLLGGIYGAFCLVFATVALIFAYQRRNKRVAAAYLVFVVGRNLIVLQNVIYYLLLQQWGCLFMACVFIVNFFVIYVAANFHAFLTYCPGRAATKPDKTDVEAVSITCNVAPPQAADMSPLPYAPQPMVGSQARLSTVVDVCQPFPPPSLALPAGPPSLAEARIGTQGSQGAFHLSESEPSCKLEQNPTTTSDSSTQSILSSKQSDGSHQTTVCTDARSDEHKNEQAKNQHGDRSSGHYRSDHRRDRNHRSRRSSHDHRDGRDYSSSGKRRDSRRDSDRSSRRDTHRSSSSERQSGREKDKDPATSAISIELVSKTENEQSSSEDSQDIVSPIESPKSVVAQ